MRLMLLTLQIANFCWLGEKEGVFFNLIHSLANLAGCARDVYMEVQCVYFDRMQVFINVLVDKIISTRRFIHLPTFLPLRIFFQLTTGNEV